MWKHKVIYHGHVRIKSKAMEESSTKFWQVANFTTIVKQNMKSRVPTMRQ
jgi:hypothetical protein